MRPVSSLAAVETLVAFVAAFAAEASFAQLVPPRALDIVQPDPPTNQAGQPIEGWAVMRYSVLADGSTANVRVIRRMPERLRERDLVEAVESWSFEPAASDGETVEWHNGESVIVFDDPDISPEPRPQFVTGYREIEELIREQEFEDAERRSRRLLSFEASRLSEMGVALVQNARVHIALGDWHQAYAAIRQATDPALMLLQPSELIVALAYRNTLELRLGDFVGALETFARRQALGPIPENDVMAENVEAIRSALDGDAAIAVQGKMLNEIWLHKLERRTFAIGDVDGVLQTVRLDCDRGRADFVYSDQSEWTVPESWGNCTVSVEGRRNTDFVLYEFR